jgi:hypothetical protein
MYPMNNDKIEKELLDIAPRLSEMEKKNPFLLPSGYFDELPQHIQQRLETASLMKRHSFGRNLIPKLAIAGFSVLLLLSGYFYFLKDSNQESVLLANESFYEDHFAWYSEYQTDVYYDLIFSAYNDVGDEAGLDEISDDHLTEYLLDYDEYFMSQIPLDFKLEN